MDKRFTNLLMGSLLAITPLGMNAQGSTSPGTESVTANAVFSETFDTEDDFLDFTVLNNNGGAAWAYDSSNKAAVLTHSLQEYKPQTDDWLISPEIELKAGTKYTLNFLVWGNGGWTTFKGEYSVAVGEGDDPTSYNKIIDRTEIRTTDKTTASTTFTVEKDGSYHIGIHATNEDDNDYGQVSMFVDDISVVGSSTAAPGPVTDLKVTPDGANLKATVSFKAPVKDIAGGDLTDITKIDVFRGETLVGTVENPAPGSDQSVVDESPALGNNTYKVVASNANGTGDDATVTAWIGSDTPKPVTEVKVTRDSKGAALLSWKMPTEGVNGGHMDPSAVTYTVTRWPDNKVVSEGKSGTTLTDAVDMTKEGKVFYYSVVAATAPSLKSDSVVSSKIYLGKAFAAPYSENFATDPTSTYAIIDANADGYTWQWSEENQAMTNTYPWWNPSDDWLLTPTIALEGGWAYHLSYKASANEDDSSQVEKISASFGKDGDPSSFTEIVPTTEYRGGQYTETAKNFNINETGDYQIGFHLTSDGLMWGTWFDNVSVQKFVKLSAPDSVKNIRIVPTELGKLSATVSFIAPKQTAGLDPLSSITKIDLWRADAKGENLTLIHTFDAPAPGAELSYVDDKALQGFNIYYLRAYNGDGVEGEGIMSGAYEYVGEDIPLAPTDAKAKDNFDGTVTVTWKAPEGKGVYGKWVNPATLSYTIYSVEGGSYTPVATVKDGATEGKVTLTQQGPQVQFGYAVAATTVGGTGDASETSNIIVGGAAYELPMRESFKGGVMSKAWWANWDADYSMMQVYTYMSSDNDGGSYMLWNAYGTNISGTLTGGKIRTEDGRDMELTFDYWGTKDKPMSIKTEAITPDGQVIELNTVSETPADDQWHKATVDASQLASQKYVRLKFTLTAEQSNDYIMIDNIVMREMLQYDLGVNSMSTPYKVEAGKDAEVTVSVINNATEEAVGDDYTVELYVNGEKTMETPGEDIEPDAVKDFRFSIPTSVNDKEPFEVYAKINYMFDMQDNNNTSSTDKVIVRVPGYPVVENLAATDGKLTWSAPESNEKSTLEDFEDYENGQIDGLDPWTTYDGDGTKTLAAMLGANMSLPNYDKPMAFIIFNPVKSGLNLDYNPGLVAHSGSQFISSFAGLSEDNSQIIAHDDMLISPELSGEAQTIKFWAKSLVSELPESFQVLTSSTTNESTAFDTASPALDVNQSTPDSWTEYTAELPEGTKYFAIRSYGWLPTETGYEFLLDDVEYNVTAPAITGYNVYSDGKKVASVTAAEALEYTAEEGHAYNVTAVFEDGGESRFSNTVTVTPTGIDETEASAASMVSTADGKIVVRGAEGTTVSVFTTTGAKIYGATGKEYTEIPVQRGQYLVRVGTKTANVVVK